MGALSVLLASIAAGIIQARIAQRQAEFDRQAVAEIRQAERSTIAADRKRELYLRWLKWQTHASPDMEDALVEGAADTHGAGTFLSTFSHALADFRAEMFLYGSPEVRALTEGTGKVWGAYLDRYEELRRGDDAKPKDKREGAGVSSKRAVQETVLVHAAAVAEAMRADLEQLHS